MGKIESIREFLESIPQFIADLEPGDEYTSGENLPNGMWKTLQGFEVEETGTGNGFNVSGFLAPPLPSIITLSGWHNYKANNRNTPDDSLYMSFVASNGLMTSFVLEDFCERFSDFYNEFLNDGGFVDNEVVVSGNSISLVEVPETSFDEAVDSETVSTDE